MASGALKDYLGIGLASARPTTPSLATGVAGYWFATDTGALSVWNGVGWTPAGGGGGGGWSLLNSWDFASAGAINHLDTINIVAGEIWILCVGITKSANDTIGVLLSTNNGTTYFNTSGDYVGGGAAGSPFSSALMQTPAISTTRTVNALIVPLQVVGAKVIDCPIDDDHYTFVGSTAAVNAIRVGATAGGTTFTAGKIYVYGR